MKKTRQCLALATALVVLLAGCSKQGGSQTQGQASSMSQAQEAYLAKVDVDYSFALAKQMEEIRSNEVLGYRTAGSQAELDTGDMLKAEMESIGLSNVTKDPFTLDTWEFTRAKLTFTNEQGEQTVELGGYQTNFSTQGAKAYTVIDGGAGTEADLRDLDVKGKLVLIYINQRDNWWINYPAYEAKLHGAAAVLAVQDGGYGEVSEDALNAQDICGPADAPAFSISPTHANALRAAMTNGEVAVTLDAESKVGLDGTSYNIVGTIPGKNPDQMVLMSAHYDSYFAGFQDDNAAIALMMGIAKGLVDSGYQPEKTLVFCAMAAEEWGVSNTRYDWSTGAYNQIFRVHPEWAGKITANINFELPAMNEGETDQIRAAYELKTFLEAFTPKVKPVEGVFPKGIEVITPTQTWSDDFSLSIAGVPAVVTALRGDFARTHYHTQFDNADTYSKEAYLLHHNLYGTMMIAYDRCAVSPLDFSTRMQAMRESVNAAVFTAAGVDSKALTDATDTVQQAATSAYAKVKQANDDYQAAVEAGDAEKAATLLQESAALNTAVLDAFRYAQDELVRLTWEDEPIFPHEHAQRNLSAIDRAIAALQKGDGETALDATLYLVDNNWYAYDWSRQTYDYFTNYVLNQPADRLMWGAGRVQGHENLFDVIRGVQQKVKAGQENYETELAALELARNNQIALLKQQTEQELTALKELGARLQEMAQ